MNSSKPGSEKDISELGLGLGRYTINGTDVLINPTYVVAEHLRKKGCCLTQKKSAPNDRIIIDTGLASFAKFVDRKTTVVVIPRVVFIDPDNDDDWDMSNIDAYNASYVFGCCWIVGESNYFPFEINKDDMDGASIRFTVEDEKCKKKN